MSDITGEGLFLGRDKPDPETVWTMYETARGYNNGLNLYDTVNTNENFFIGKQWEGVNAAGLPTPVFNILKRDISFIVASITSENVHVQAAAYSASPRTSSLSLPVRILNEELDAVFTRENLTKKIREFSRDAAVRGDGCIYAYWDNDMETGQYAKGGIRLDVLANTRVLFGNPNSADVQSQPWIIIERREIVRNARRRARKNGSGEWESILADDDNTYLGAERRTSDKVTCLLTFWKDDDTGAVWCYESTKGATVSEARDTGLKYYPLVWINWDKVQDCYHGQAMLTGLIPNQVLINKLWAMSALSMMTTAFPKTVYDGTRITTWTNRVGEAIRINGGDVATVAKVLDPAPISPQVSELIGTAVDQTNNSVGATSVALGDTRPDNTSAIIALQRAAQTPSESTKQNIRDAIEELSAICMDFMATYYGVRIVDATMEEQPGAMSPGLPMGGTGEMTIPFDFTVFKNLVVQIRLDAGTSTYYSEVASLTTLDNLLMQGKIDIVDYLERIPDGYIPKRQELLNRLRERLAMAMMPQETGASGEPVTADYGKTPIPTHGGYSDLQRKVTSGEEVV